MKVKKLAHFPKVLDSNWMGTTPYPGIPGTQKKHTCLERWKESSKTHKLSTCWTSTQDQAGRATLRNPDTLHITGDMGNGGGFLKKDGAAGR